jgi:hypothetical protein
MGGTSKLRSPPPLVPPSAPPALAHISGDGRCWRSRTFVQTTTRGLQVTEQQLHISSMRPRPPVSRGLHAEPPRSRALITARTRGPSRPPGARIIVGAAVCTCPSRTLDSNPPHSLAHTSVGAASGDSSNCRTPWGSRATCQPVGHALARDEARNFREIDDALLHAVATVVLRARCFSTTSRSICAVRTNRGTCATRSPHHVDRCALPRPQSSRRDCRTAASARGFASRSASGRRR